MTPRSIRWRVALDGALFAASVAMLIYAVAA